MALNSNIHTLEVTPHSILLSANDTEGDGQVEATVDFVSRLAPGPLKAWFNQTYLNGGAGSSSNLSNYNAGSTTRFSKRLRVSKQMFLDQMGDADFEFTTTGISVASAATPAAGFNVLFEIRLLHSLSR